MQIVIDVFYVYLYALCGCIKSFALAETIYFFNANTITT